MRDIFGLPTLGEFYEEFNSLNSILERETEVFQQVVALAELSLDSHHKFKAETWIKNMLQKGPGKKTTFWESLKTLKKKVVTVDPSSVSPRRKKPKYTTSYVDCP